MWKIDAGVGDDNLAKVIGQRDELAKQLADLADRVEKSMAKVTEIVARNNDYQKQIATLTKRLAELQPPRVIADNAIARADQLLSGMETAVADVKAKTAEGRFTGYILVVFPVVLFFVSYYLNPGYASVLLHTSTGLWLLATAGVMLMLGTWCIRKITTIKV